MDDHDQLELLSELNHLQWADHTKYTIQNLELDSINDIICKTDTEYPDLSEEDKENHRSWIRRLLRVLEF